MRLNPGDNAPSTGSYKMIRNGETINTVYVHQGDRMPPTPDETCYYETEN